MKTRERLVDLVFNELDPEARRRALVEIENCPGCLAQYQSMTETLRVFDHAAEIATPDEGYWPGYEARLRERLRPEEPRRLEESRRLEGPSLKQRLERWIGGFWPLTSRPLQLVAGLALVLLAIGWWSWRQRQAVGTSPIDNQVATATPTPQTKVESLAKDIAAGPKTEVITRKPKPIYPKAVKSDVEAPPVRRDEQVLDIVKHDVVSRGLDQPLIAASLFTPETIRHFEKAQLMLRSFRNVGVGKASRIRAPIDLDYEKQLSRRLLYQNILLRRDAEMKGDLPAEEALSNLEPFLLDIANLPDKPSPDELRGIRERLQRKELIASLQISSARPSAPAYQNP